MSDTAIEKCFYCDAPAVRFCDFHIGGPIGGYERVGPIEDAVFRAYFDVDQMPYTCDMRMCADHNKQVGTVFMPGDITSIDYCPEHLGEDEGRCSPCTESEAETIRGNIRANARRRLIRAHNRHSSSEGAVK